MHKFFKPPNSYGLALAFFLTVLGYGLNFYIDTPVVQADEGCTLANAAAIAGFFNSLANSYHAGYSLLISPAFLLGNCPAEVWNYVKCINLVLFYLFVYFLWLFSYIVNSEIGEKQRIFDVAIVSLYPMAIVFTGYSLANFALIPLFMFSCWFIYKILDIPPYAWFFFGLVTSSFYWIHPTGIAPVVSIFLTLFIVSYTRKRWFSFSFFVLAILVSLIIYKFYFQPWLSQRMQLDGAFYALNYEGTKAALRAFIINPDFADLVLRFFGHVFYYCVGSLGFIPFGLYCAIKQVLRYFQNKSNDTNFKHFVVSFLICINFIAVTMIPILMFSAQGAMRLDHWMYGRYVEFSVYPILLYGVLSVSYRKIAWTVPLLVLSAFLIRNKLKLITLSNSCNVPALVGTEYILSEKLFFFVLIICILVFVISFSKKNFSKALLLLLFSFAIVFHVNYHYNIIAFKKDNRWVQEDVIRTAFPKGSKIFFDSAKSKTDEVLAINFLDISFLFYDYILQRKSFDTWKNEKTDTPFFSFQKFFMEGVYPIGFTNAGLITYRKGSNPEGKLDTFPLVVSRELTAKQYVSFGSGWHGLQQNHVWSDLKANLLLDTQGTSLEKNDFWVLTFYPFAASEKRPVDVSITTHVNQNTITQKHIFYNSKPVDIEIPFDHSTKLQTITLETPQATSPKAMKLSADGRTLGICLLKIATKMKGPVYHHGMPIVFSKPLASNIQQSGLSGVERWGRWSDANVRSEVALKFDTDLPLHFQLVLKATALGKNVGQPVRVVIGGETRSFTPTGTLTEHRLKFTLKKASRLIEIFPFQPVTPKELGIGDDRRKLAIGFESMLIEAIEPPEAGKP